MNARELVKKLGKLLGKKESTPAAVGAAAMIHPVSNLKAPEFTVQVLDGLGVIYLHENWRN
jgi:hypothetical protein